MRWTAALAFVLLSGCVRAPFVAIEPPSRTLRYELADLPYSEYWTGIVFNGAKIGFSHFSIRPDRENFIIESKASLRFRLLGIDKTVKLISFDRVTPDLRLKEFSYDYELDLTRMSIHGYADGERLHTVTIDSAGRQERSVDLAEPLYPLSAALLYPLLHGLETGATYEFLVYDGENQRLTPFRQEVVGFERSPLFDGPAYKVESAMYANRTTTWIDLQGRPALERSINDILIAGLESEERAHAYLSQAALNKDEVLLDFSRVRADRVVPNPRGVERLEIRFAGMNDLELPASNARQHCRAETGRGVLCRVDVQGRGSDAPREAALERTPIILTGHPALQRLAEEIAGGLEAPQDRMNALVEWIHAHIAGEAVDVFNALDVLEQRKAECQGQSFLYASLARSLDIPTRIVNGLVYSDSLDGFYYHTWAQSWDGSSWHSIDPTFGQTTADATHVRLIDGETVADISPLLQIMGRVSASIVDYAPR